MVSRFGTVTVRTIGRNRFYFEIPGNSEVPTTQTQAVALR